MFFTTRHGDDGRCGDTREDGSCESHDGRCDPLHASKNIAAFAGKWAGLNSSSDASAVSVSRGWRVWKARFRAQQWGSEMRRRIVGGTVVIMLVVLACLEIPIGLLFSGARRDAFEARVRADAYAIALSVTSATDAASVGPRAKVVRLAADARVVVVDREGSVVFDSDPIGTDGTTGRGGVGRDFSNRTELPCTSLRYRSFGRGVPTVLSASACRAAMSTPPCGRPGSFFWRLPWECYRLWSRWRGCGPDE